MRAEATGGPLARLAHAINTARQLAQNARGKDLAPETADEVASRLREALRLIREAKAGEGREAGPSPAPKPAREKSQPTRRRLLWRRDPRCFWCGRVTVFEAHNTPEAATVEHVYPRTHPRRRDTRRHLPSKVLACYGCNQARGAPTANTSDVCPVVKIAAGE